ncbi:Rmf/CrpP fold protein [Streptomyces lavendulae]|uniref:Rmf/CrpP fold protein n=1 Tax=Streptomyces lavendulae TaxID=1914 RepID=UPI0031E611F9
MGTRADIVQAHQAGADAGRRGDPPTVCPYGRSDIRRAMWLKGYVAGRREAGQPAVE